VVVGEVDDEEEEEAVHYSFSLGAEEEAPVHYSFSLAPRENECCTGASFLSLLLSRTFFSH